MKKIATLSWRGAATCVRATKTTCEGTKEHGSQGRVPEFAAQRARLQARARAGRAEPEPCHGAPTLPCFGYNRNRWRPFARGYSHALPGCDIKWCDADGHVQALALFTAIYFIFFPGLHGQIQLLRGMSVSDGPACEGLRQNTPVICAGGGWRGIVSRAFARDP